MIDKKGSLNKIAKTYAGTIESLGTAGLQQGFFHQIKTFKCFFDKKKCTNIS